MTVNKSEATTVTLSCGHSVSFWPIPNFGDMLWCGRCDDWHRYIAAEEWHVKCLNCRLNRKYGADEHGCKRIAVQHVAKHVTHTVEVARGGCLMGIVKTKDLPPVPGSLPDRYHTVTI